MSIRLQSWETNFVFITTEESNLGIPTLPITRY